jgi:hypothetical protein
MGGKARLSFDQTGELVGAFLLRTGLLDQGPLGPVQWPRVRTPARANPNDR